jgi:hypothetical protein
LYVDISYILGKEKGWDCPADQKADYRLFIGPGTGLVMAELLLNGKATSADTVSREARRDRSDSGKGVRIALILQSGVCVRERESVTSLWGVEIPFWGGLIKGLRDRERAFMSLRDTVVPRELTIAL